MSEPAANEFLTGYPGDALREALQDRYRHLLTNITSSDHVLVLTPARAAWEELLRTLDAPTGARRVHTPLGFIQQELALWWPAVDENLAALGIPAARGVAGPAFVAIDLAQHLVERFAAPLADEEGGLVPGARSPARQQRLQVLDALARGVESFAGLLPAEAAPPDGALAALLHEAGIEAPAPARRLAAGIAARLDACYAPGQRAAAFAPRMGAAIAAYAGGMLRWRMMDHALALAVYAELLWPDPRYRARFHEATRWLLAEDLDELPARWLAIVHDALAGGTRGVLVLKSDPGAPDPRTAFKGGLREYVGAARDRAWAIAPRPQVVASAAEAPPLADLGRALAEGLRERPRRAEVAPGRVKLRLDAYAVPEMLEAVAQDLAALLPTVPPSRIALVTPSLSPMLIWSLRARLERLGVPLYVFAGTNMLTDHRAVRLLLTLARLCHPGWAAPPSRFELLEVLEAVTGQNPLKLGRLAPALCPDGRLCDPDDLPDELDADARLRYAHLMGFLARHEGEAPDLEAFFREAFAEVWAPFQPRHAPGSPADEAAAREVSQIGQLIELAARFRDVDQRLEGDADGRGRRFLDYLRAAPIAERPFFKREPHTGAIMLATASQLAEKGFAEPAEKLDHLIVLDFGSERWWKSDRKELTNARVLAADRPVGPYDPEEDERDRHEKLARVLQACCLKVREAMWVHACLTDEEGRENLGDLPNLIGGALGLVMAEARA